MPSTVNTIGTRYFWRRSVVTHTRVCERCQKTGPLSTFDTRLWICVLFIPVIPLWGVHVVDFCSRCTGHRVMSLRKWNRALEEDVGGAARALQQNPDDPAAAVRFIKTAAAFDVPERLWATLPAMGPNLRSNRDVLVALGDAYVRFEMLPQADAAYKAAGAIESSRSLLRSMARSALLQQHSNQARGHIEMLIAQKDDSAVTLAHWLIEQYQATGRYDEALSLLATLAKQFPDQAKQPKHKAYVDASNEGLRTGGRVKVKRRKATEGVSNGRILALVAIVALVLSAVFVANSLRIAATRPLWIVNGTGEPYSVTVGTVSATINPRSATRMFVGEGEHTLKAEGAHIHQTRTVNMTTSFWSRPFDDDMFLINPDGVALLEHESAIYRPVSPPPPVFKYLLADHLQHLTGINHPFERMPSTIALSRGGVTRRESLNFASTDPSRDTVAMAAQVLGEAQAVAAAKRGVQFDPNNGSHVDFLRLRVPIGEILPLIEPLLQEKPLMLHAHRFAQDTVRTDAEAKAMADRYATLLAESPQDATLMCLAGRCALDRDRAIELLTAATLAAKPEPLAFRALSTALVADGEFAEVCKVGERALAAGVRDDALTRCHFEALIALQRTDQALALVGGPSGHGQSLPRMFDEWAMAMTMQGKAEQAMTAVIDAVANNRISKEESEPLRRTIIQALHQSGLPAGKLASLVAAFAQEEAKNLPDRSEEIRAIIPPEIQTATPPEELSEIVQSSKALMSLKLTLRAAASGDSAGFKTFAAQWIKQLSTGDRPSRRLANCINNPAQALDAVRASNLPIEWMAAAYVVLGQMHPEIRDRAYERAEWLNVLPSETYLLVKAALAKPTSPATSPGRSRGPKP